MLFARPVPVRNSVAVACRDACSTRGSPNDSSGKSSERSVHLMSHGASRSTSTLHRGPAKFRIDLGGQAPHDPELGPTVCSR